MTNASGTSGGAALTESTYFSPEAQAVYMSASQFKAFRTCEAAALAEIRGEWLP